MNKLKIILITSFLSHLALAIDADPNSYFKNREWKVPVAKDQVILVTSKYQTEPIRTPNTLEAKLECLDKKFVDVITELKYCGINSIKTIGGKLEIIFVDFNSEHPLGYCTKTRTQYFKIPTCPSK
jgi:hypothetical protein